jgi:hypothetical protein
MPAPKFAVVAPGGNNVFDPTIVTKTLALWAPLLGAIVKLGGPVSVMVSELTKVNPAPDAVTVYTPPALEGAKKFIDRPTPVPVTTLATVMGDPPPCGVNITDTDGAEAPAAKPLAVVLTGVFGLAVLGSMLTRVMFCAYKGVKPRVASRNVRKTTPRFLRIAGKKQRWIGSKVLPGLRLLEIGRSTGRDYSLSLLQLARNFRGVSEYPCVWDRNFLRGYPHMRLAL